MGKEREATPHKLAELPEEYTRIAHLTDLHVHSSNKERGGTSRFYQLCVWLEEIAEIGVDGLVISGDLVETPGDSRSLQKVKRKLEDSDLDWSVVPGNHDLKLDGRPEVFYEMFGQYPRCERYGRVELLLFDSMGGLPVKDRGFVENVLSKLPAVGCWTEGTIGDRQFDEVSDRMDDSVDGQRVAVIHHHVQPQPPDPVFFSLLTNEGAGTMKPLFDGHRLVSWAKKHGVGTVLHGHKHQFMQPGFTEGLLVINGGSSTQHLQRNKARIIDFGPDGEKVVHQVELHT